MNRSGLVVQIKLCIIYGLFSKIISGVLAAFGQVFIANGFYAKIFLDNWYHLL